MVSTGSKIILRRKCRPTSLTVQIFSQDIGELRDILIVAGVEQAKTYMSSPQIPPDTPVLLEAIFGSLSVGGSDTDGQILEMLLYLAQGGVSAAVAGI